MHISSLSITSILKEGGSKIGKSVLVCIKRSGLAADQNNCANESLCYRVSVGVCFKIKKRAAIKWFKVGI